MDEVKQFFQYNSSNQFSTKKRKCNTLIVGCSYINNTISGNMVASAMMKVRQENNQRYCCKWHGV